MKNNKVLHKIECDPPLCISTNFMRLMIDSMPHHTKEALMYNAVKLYTNFNPYATSFFSTV